MQNRTRLFIHRFMVEYSFKDKNVSTILEIPTCVGKLPELPVRIWPCFSPKDQLTIAEDTTKPGLGILIDTVRALVSRQLSASRYHEAMLEKFWEILRVEFAGHSGLFVVDPNHPRPEVRTMLGASVGTDKIKITTLSISIHRQGAPIKRENAADQLKSIIDRFECKHPAIIDWLKASLVTVDATLKQWSPDRIGTHQLLVVPIRNPDDSEYFEIYRPVMPTNFIPTAEAKWSLGKLDEFAIELMITANPEWTLLAGNPAEVFGVDPSIPMEYFELIGVVG